jgi:hypothetical protein
MDLMRRMSPEEKLQRALELSSAMRCAREAGLRQAYPQAGEREIFLRLAREALGSELYCKVYGEGLPLDGSVQPDFDSDHSRV